MREIDMFPHGLTRAEIQLLEVTSEQPKTKSVLQMMVPALQSNMANSIAYLMGNDFLVADSSGTIKTSPKGIKFVNTLKKIKFI
jgi:predicted transcriptional regulator